MTDNATRRDPQCNEDLTQNATKGHIDSATAMGLRLREARVASGLTQKAIAFPGCTTGYISRLERGERTPSLQVVRELAKRLGVSKHWLAVGEQDSAESTDEQTLRDATLALRSGQEGRRGGDCLCAVRCICRPADTGRRLCRTWTDRVYERPGPGDADGAVSYARCALALLDASDDRIYAARAYQMLAHVELDAGRSDAALSALERGRQLLGSNGAPHDLFIYSLEEARLLAALGRSDEAAALAMQSARSFCVGYALSTSVAATPHSHSEDVPFVVEPS